MTKAEAEAVARKIFTEERERDLAKAREMGIPEKDALAMMAEVEKLLASGIAGEITMEEADKMCEVIGRRQARDSFIKRKVAEFKTPGRQLAETLLARNDGKTYTREQAEKVVDAIVARNEEAVQLTNLILGVSDEQSKRVMAEVRCNVVRAITGEMPVEDMDKPPEQLS